MLIKTISGIELGGGVSVASARDSLPFIEPGEQCRVEYKFKCALNPGVYFLNAGVVGDVNGSETFLHRLVDVAMFRVLSESNNLSTGIIDFECSPKVELFN
jgi:lipopolysaccharide transport system ATP-binding protein